MSIYYLYIYVKTSFKEFSCAQIIISMHKWNQMVHLVPFVTDLSRSRWNHLSDPWGSPDPTLRTTGQKDKTQKSWRAYLPVISYQVLLQAHGALRTHVRETQHGPIERERQQ